MFTVAQVWRAFTSICGRIILCTSTYRRRDDGNNTGVSWAVVSSTYAKNAAAVGTGFRFVSRFTGRAWPPPSVRKTTPGHRPNTRVVLSHSKRAKDHHKVLYVFSDDSYGRCESPTMWNENHMSYRSDLHIMRWRVNCADPNNSLHCFLKTYRTTNTPIPDYLRFTEFIGLFKIIVILRKTIRNTLISWANNINEKIIFQIKNPSCLQL